jgi:hypothetical protein
LPLLAIGRDDRPGARQRTEPDRTAQPGGFAKISGKIKSKQIFNLNSTQKIKNWKKKVRRTH